MPMSGQGSESTYVADGGFWMKSSRRLDAGVHDGFWVRGGARSAFVGRWKWSGLCRSVRAALLLVSILESVGHMLKA